MDIVLDTHVVVWHSLDNSHLSEAAKSAIQDASIADNLIISCVTLWEIAWLAKKERIILKIPYLEYIKTLLKSDPYQIIDISPDIAFLGADFDTSISSDPSDRIIAATAVKYNAPLVTADKNLRKSTLVKTIW